MVSKWIHKLSEVQRTSDCGMLSSKRTSMSSHPCIPGKMAEEMMKSVKARDFKGVLETVSSGHDRVIAIMNSQ